MTTTQKRSRRTPEEKEFALVLKRDTGRRLKTLVEDKAVQAFFDAYQKRLVTEMIGKSGEAGDALRIAGLKMQAFLAFKQEISGLVGEGQAAETQLARMKSDG